MPRLRSSFHMRHGPLRAISSKHGKNHEDGGRPERYVSDMPVEFVFLFIMNSSVLKQRDGVRVAKATIEAFRNEPTGKLSGCPVDPARVAVSY